MFFFAQNSSFYCSVALLCNAKKPSFGQKIPIFRFNQKSQDEFKYKQQLSWYFSNGLQIHLFMVQEDYELLR